MDSNPPTPNVPPPPPIQVPEFTGTTSAPNTPTPSSSSPSPSPSPSGGHENDARVVMRYRGTRCRSRKWVSEIREPRKAKRIWLGTYSTPDMAAAAYDVAALALKGPDTTLNFPNSILSYPIPASLSAADIRAAAAAAAQARAVTPPQSGGHNSPSIQRQGSSSTGQGLEKRREQQYIDEDELLNMPNLLEDMARGMQVSPPRIRSISSDDSPGNSDHGDNLWSYDY